MGMYEHAGDVAADNEAPVMYHRILVSATSDAEYDDDKNADGIHLVRLTECKILYPFF